MHIMYDAEQWSNLMKYVVITDSMFFDHECLVERYDGDKIVGCNYIPRTFTQADLEPQSIKLNI